ncbi:MAG: cation:proton antiporter, partial [Acutalibacteraceae bacterium]
HRALKVFFHVFTVKLPCKFSNKESLAIGIGMVSRGEVALIVAQKGAQAGIIDEKLFPAIVLVVIVTTIITPILLKLVLADKKHKNKPQPEDNVAVFDAQNETEKEYNA